MILNQTFSATRAQSLDPRARRDGPIDFDFNDPPCRTPVLCNKYAIDDLDIKQASTMKRHGAQSMSTMPRPQPSNNKYNEARGGLGGGGGRFEQTPHTSPPLQHRYMPDEDFEMQPIRKNKRRERHGNLFYMIV